MAQKHVTLYTVQDPRKYAKTKGKPWGCKHEQWVFVDLARYLGWNYWLSAFSDIKDFKNEWLNLEEALDKDLWILSVPRHEVRWCALSAQCQNRGAVRNWFSKDPHHIREKEDIPLGIIRVPVLPAWVSKKMSAKKGFQAAGIWEPSPH